MSYINKQATIDALLSAQPETHDERTETHACDLISRAAAIDTAMAELDGGTPYNIPGKIERLPSVQPEPCEYYALCRHGRDENKLRTRLGFCEYCNKNADGFVTPMEKNGHAFVRFGMNGWELSMKANGWHGSAKIRYCPMCGMDLLRK